MSCLDTFYLSYFEEREEYSRMTEKGLELDKADFVVNGYEVDKLKYPQHPDKDASPSGKGKMRADEVMTIDLSDDETDEENVVPLDDENATLDPDTQESSDDEDDEGNSGGQSIPLVGSRLGGVSACEEENEELTRLRIQATPRKLFDSSS
jgi:hypothetical protein